MQKLSKSANPFHIFNVGIPLCNTVMYLTLLWYCTMGSM